MRVTVVGLCVSVSQPLTSGVSVRPENDTMYSTANEGPNICVDFSENAFIYTCEYLKGQCL